MLLDGLQVPDELKSFWALVVKANAGTINQTVRLNYPSVSRYKGARLVDNSLFVLWEPLWQTFLFDRRIRWTNYWGTLPFGTHSGVGFWPGSGFSAFVYVNAPRLKAGLPLLLEPPYAVDIMLNPRFDGNADHWELFSSAFYNNHKITLPAYPWSNPRPYARGHFEQNGFDDTILFELRIHANGYGFLGIERGNSTPYTLQQFTGNAIWTLTGYPFAYPQWSHIGLRGINGNLTAFIGDIFEVNLIPLN
jgi:hypothetical protein